LLDFLFKKVALLLKLLFVVGFLAQIETASFFDSPFWRSKKDIVESWKKLQEKNYIFVKTIAL
jgi:hypothetical protein